MLRLVDRGLSESKIPLHITESDTNSYKSKQRFFENHVFLRLTVHCIATNFRNPEKTIERKLKNKTF